MPGFKTHYLFGREALRTYTPNSHEQYLYRYVQSYNIGCQGPDVFFYYLPAWLLFKHNIGNVIHKSKTNAFFKALIDARNSLIKKEHRLIADAYISGFIAHYTLDSAMHPYIYYRTNNKAHADRKLYDFGIHVFLETDIDNALLRHYTHMRPSEMRMGDTIKLSPIENIIISLVLHRAISTAYPDDKVPYVIIRHSLSAMATEANLMRDPTGIKKMGVRFLERLFVGHAVVSGMIPSDKVTRYKDPCNLRRLEWRNPWAAKEVRTESVYDLIDESSKVLEERIHLYSTAHTLSREVSDAEKSACLKELYASLGDRSYLTGL